MGEGFLFREQFSKAKDLKDEQDAWCSLQDDAIKARGKQAIKFIHKSFPNDIKLDSLVALLRDEVKLQNHCYEVKIL